MIVTDRLLLRRWRREDAAPLHDMGYDPLVMRYVGLPLSRRECTGLMRRQNAEAGREGRCFWALELRTSGVFLGLCGVGRGDPGTPVAGQLEIGWRLARAAWGRGYAQEAAQACLDAEWRRGTRSVAAYTVPANRRSRGLMARLGMTRDLAGDFRHPDLRSNDPLSLHLTYRIARPR